VAFFPDPATIRELTENLKPTEFARLFHTTVDLPDLPCVLRHQRSVTACTNLKDTPEALFQLIKKNTRNEIRQIEKLGDRTRVGLNSDGIVDDFLPLFNEFAGSTAGVERISRSVLDPYGDKLDIFVAYLDGSPMCGHVMLRDDDASRVRLLYSANRRLTDPAVARICGALNRYLHWHEIGAYREKGFATYDWGGLNDDEANGIRRFKLSFGGTIVKEHTYLCAGSPALGRLVLGIFGTLVGRGRRQRQTNSSAAPAPEPE
jgi:hypothetical protein